MAAIKLAPPLTPGMRSSGMPLGLRLDKAQASFGGMSLSAPISYAYGVKLAQISGPDWLVTQRFDIVTKLPEGGFPQQVPEMMQTLLAERFDLKLQRESKQFLVYALVAGKTGIKLSPKPEDFDPKAHNDQIAIPVLSLTLLLEQSLGVPVVDETGQKGQYLFPSEVIQQVLRAGTAANAQQPAASASGGVVENADPAESDFTALLLAAGMKLEKKKANLPVLVVQSMRQTPTEN
ncbi:MAG: TIGR03435 family protein [Bryobacteraceae bacterium]